MKGRTNWGGQINLAAKAPYRGDFGGIIRHLTQQVKRLGVNIKTGTEVTPDMVLTKNPDGVVIATGSYPARTGFTPLYPTVDELPGVDRENVLTVWDVFLGRAPIGNHVVVIDDNDHWEAAGTVEYLADQGKKVEVITRLSHPWSDLLLTHDLEFLLPRLREKGVVITKGTGVRRILENQVIVSSTSSEEERLIDGVDTVVLVMQKIANDRLYHALKGKVRELHRIGDCVAPRNVGTAIYDGNQIGREI